MAALLREAGYGVDETVLVGLRLPGIGELYVAQGDLTRDSIVYALLIQRGVLDLDSAPTDWLPGMPDWVRAVRLRHPVHHTAGLPPDAAVEDGLLGDRSTERLLASNVWPVSRCRTSGVGVRSRRGHRVYRHGGGWDSLRAMLARAPSLELGLVIFALADGTERRVTLTDSLMDLLIVPSSA